MGLVQNAFATAGYTAGNLAIRSQVNSQITAMQPKSLTITNEDIRRQVLAPENENFFPQALTSENENLRRQALAFAQSDAVNYVTMAGGALLAAYSGVLSAAAVANGMCYLSTGAIIAGAARGLGVAGAAVFAGIGAGKVGEFIGENATHLAMKYILGKTPVPTSGNQPICLGDKVYHQNTDFSFWGVLGGFVLGGLVAGVGMATFGLGLLAGAALAGLTAGLSAGIGNALSEYGEEKGKVVEGSPDVFFEGLPVARVGDKIQCADHTQPHLIAEGAKTVFANGRPIARLGHKTTCDGNLVGGCKTIFETEETSSTIRLPIQSSVPLWLEELTTYTGLVLNIAGLAKGFKGSAKARTTVGEPVDVARGDFVQEWQVLAFEQVLPLRLNRYYYSTQRTSGHLGQKWFDEWSQHLSLAPERNEIIYTNEKGANYHYPIGEQKEVYAQNRYSKEHILFGQIEDKLYLFNRTNQQTCTFEKLPHQSDNKRYLTAIEDRLGNQIRFIYHQDELIRVEHSDGFALNIEREQTLIKRISYQSSDYNHVLAEFSHNSLGQLTHCVSFQFGQLHHQYNQTGLMTEWRDSQATIATIYYDEQGRVIATETESGHYADRFEYDDENHCTTYIDAEGGISRYWYNHDYLITKYQNPLGYCYETKWEDGEKTEEIDPLGRKTTYTYNAYGELVALIEANGDRYQYEYNATGRLTKQTTALGDWQYEYGDRNELRRIISPEKLVWAYRYNERFQRIREELPNGNYIGYGYNARQQLSHIKDQKGELTYYERDIFNRITHLTQADKSEYRYEYSQAHANPRGSVSAIYYPEGSVERFAYNSEQLLIAETDGNGFSKTYGYGVFDLLQWQESAQGERLYFHYDKLTRLTAVTNPQGDSYRYEYDKAGRLIAETDFAGQRTDYVYDEVGRCIRQHKADGTVETYHYDCKDHLISRQSWQVQGVEKGEKIANYRLAHQVHYCYNAQGQLTQAHNQQYQPFSSESLTEFEYDAHHRLIAEIQDGHRISVQRDRLGREVRVQLPHSKNAVELKRAFNQFGELASLQYNNHSPLQFSYDMLGRQIEKRSEAGFYLAERFSPSGLLQAQGGGYDNALTQQQLAYYNPSQVYPISGTEISRKWTYDNAFNLRQKQDRQWGKTEYWANRNGQLQQVFAEFIEEHCQYDSQQNLTYKALVESYRREELNDKHTQWQIKQHYGRVVKQGKETYRYDQAGRLIEKRHTEKGYRPNITHYHWNSQNQLVEVRTLRKGIWRYEYDAFGRRTKKYQIDRTERVTGIPLNPTYRDSELFWRLGETDAQIAKSLKKPTALCGTQFIYKGDQLIAEIPFVENKTDWDKAIYWLYQDNALSPTATLQQGNLFYTITDQIGTITELMSEQGRIEYSQNLSLWGDWVQTYLHRSHHYTNAPPLNCNLRFLGQYEDKESGLCYNRYRYYNPTLAQYISPDPIGLLGGFNPYGYVAIPTGWVDPLGLKGCNVIEKGGKDYDIILKLDKKEYPNAFGHINDYITGKISLSGSGNNIFTLSRKVSKQRRIESLKGIPTKKGLDRDEFPMAIFSEGGKGASVRYISRSDNRGAGSSISRELAPYLDGTRVKIIVK